MKRAFWHLMRGSLAAAMCAVLVLAAAPVATAQEPRPFVDLHPDVQPTDGALATAQLTQSGNATLALLHISPVRGGFEGVVLRSYLYDGDCTNFGTRVQQAMLDITIGSDASITTVTRIQQVLTPTEARILVVYDQQNGVPWACVEIPWPTQDMLDAQAREAATNQAQVLGLAVTGSDWPSRLAVLGGTLVLGGLLFLGAASFSDRTEEGSG